MTQYIRSLGYDSPVSRLMAYVATLDGKAETLIRAQTGTEKNSKKAVARSSRNTFASEEEEREHILMRAKQGVSVTRIESEIGRARGRVQYVLGMAGFDFRHLSKHFKGRQQPNVELGRKMQELIASGVGPYKASYRLGIPARCAFESLAMAGGAINNQPNITQ